MGGGGGGGVGGGGGGGGAELNASLGTNRNLFLHRQGTFSRTKITMGFWKKWNSIELNHSIMYILLWIYYYYAVTYGPVARKSVFKVLR